MGRAAPVIDDMQQGFARRLAALLRDFAADELGQDLSEYSLLLVFVIIVVVGLFAGYHESIAGVTVVTNQNLAAASAAVR
jgi:Flp pilus assembly pilin Flp